MIPIEEFINIAVLTFNSILSKEVTQSDSSTSFIKNSDIFRVELQKNINEKIVILSSITKNNVGMTSSKNTVESTVKLHIERYYNVEFLQQLCKMNETFELLDCENKKIDPTNNGHINLPDCSTILEDKTIYRVRKNYTPTLSFTKSLEFSKKSYVKNDGTSTLSVSSPAIPRSETAWNPKKDRKETTEIDQLLGKIKGDFNKISNSNESKITENICSAITEECILYIIPFIFDKGSWDQKFREIYARLCVKINEKFPQTFQTQIVNQCQKEFSSTNLPQAQDIIVGSSQDDEDNDKIMRFMKRRMGIGYFIVDLMKVNLIDPRIVLLCITSLLKSANNENTRNDDIYHASEMIITVIPEIKKDTILKKYIPIFQGFLLFKKMNLPQRIVFKVEEVIELGKKKKIL